MFRLQSILNPAVAHLVLDPNIIAALSSCDPATECNENNPWCWTTCLWLHCGKKPLFPLAVSSAYICTIKTGSVHFTNQIFQKSSIQYLFQKDIIKKLAHIDCFTRDGGIAVPCPGLGPRALASVLDLGSQSNSHTIHCTKIYGK